MLPASRSGTTRMSARPSPASWTVVSAAAWLYSTSMRSLGGGVQPLRSGDGLYLVARPDQQWPDDADPGRLHGAAQRAFVTGVGDGGRCRRDFLTARAEAGIFGACVPSAVSSRCVGGSSVLLRWRTSAEAGLVRSLPQSACQARVREITLEAGGLMSFGWGKPTTPVTAIPWRVSCAAQQQFGLHQEPGNRLRCSGDRADFNPPMTGRRENGFYGWPGSLADPDVDEQDGGPRVAVQGGQG